METLAFWKCKARIVKLLLILEAVFKMAYSYCSKCEHSFPNPTPQEIIKGFMVCPVCEKEYPLREDEKNDLLANMFDRIVELEKKVNIINGTK